MGLFALGVLLREALLLGFGVIGRDLVCSLGPKREGKMGVCEGFFYWRKLRVRFCRE